VSFRRRAIDFRFQDETLRPNGKGPQLLDINTPANASIVMRDGFC